jgi:hypothetical protein
VDGRVAVIWWGVSLDAVVAKVGGDGAGVGAWLTSSKPHCLNVGAAESSLDQRICWWEVSTRGDFGEQVGARERWLWQAEMRPRLAAESARRWRAGVAARDGRAGALKDVEAIVATERRAAECNGAAIVSVVRVELTFQHKSLRDVGMSSETRPSRDVSAERHRLPGRDRRDKSIGDLFMKSLQSSIEV